MRIRDFELEIVIREKKTRKRIFDYRGVLDLKVFKGIEAKFR